MGKYRIIRLIIYGGIGVLCFMVMRFPGNSDENPLTDVMPTVKLKQNTVDNLDSGHWDDALDELLPMSEKEGADPNLSYYIAWCFKELGCEAFLDHRYDDAAALFEDGLWYNQADPDLYLVLGITYFKQADHDKAVNALQQVLNLDAENAEAYKQLGEIYYLQNRLYDAEAAWSMADTLDPGDTATEKRLLGLRKQIQLSETLDTDESRYFSVTYDGTAMPRLEYTVMEILESAYYDIGAKLQAYPNRQIPVTLLTREDFFDITGSPGWVSGLYEGQIKIPVAGVDLKQLKRILYHEYVHAVLYDRVGPTCPWWFNEGLAQYLSGDDAVETADNAAALPMLSELGGVLNLDEAAAIRAYRSALTGVRYLVKSFGETNLQRIIGLMAEGNSFETAFWISTGHSFDQFEKEWNAHGNVP